MSCSPKRDLSMISGTVCTFVSPSAGHFAHVGVNKIYLKDTFPARFFDLTHATAEKARQAQAPREATGQATGPARCVRLNQSRICPDDAPSGRGDRALELIADLGADGPVDRRMRPVRLARHDGIARIRGGADRHMQRNLAQKRHPQPLRLVARAAMAENVRPRAAMRALEIAHV